VQFRDILGFGRKDTEPQHLELHKADVSVQADGARHDTEKHDNTLVTVVPGVENESLEGSFGIALGRGQTVNDGFENFRYALAGFGGALEGIRAVDPDDVLNFFLHFFRMGGGKIDFVENRNDLDVLIESEVDISQGLGFNALSGVNNEQGAFACRERTGNLVVEVDVPWRVQKIEFVLLAVVRLVGNAHGLRLDGNAAFPLDVHAVKVLILGFTGADHLGDVQYAVSQSRFSVVDMRDDAEISNVAEIRHVRPV